jgi:hypothetical protein
MALLSDRGLLKKYFLSYLLNCMLELFHLRYPPDFRIGHPKPFIPQNYIPIVRLKRRKSRLVDF